MNSPYKRHAAELSHWALNFNHYSEVWKVSDIHCAGYARVAVELIERDETRVASGLVKETAKRERSPTAATLY
jgi:hypothetical protein